jgi:hypothetical protein
LPIRIADQKKRVNNKRVPERTASSTLFVTGSVLDSD